LEEFQLKDDNKKPDLTLSRRPLLQGAAGLVAAAALPASHTAAAQPAPAAPIPTQEGQSADVTGRLANYMVEATTRELPDNVVLECKHRILDTIGAMVSGARLRPGEVALEYVRSLGGTEEASVIGSDFRTTAVNAALANAMCGHADETDDFEPTTKAHPGCVVVPTALAMGEREARSGMDMIKAVALGYDLCCRIIFALGPTYVRANHRSAEGTSSGFGSLGAAAALARLNETEMRYAISYAAQQVSGLWSWVGDNEHIEKAFDFSGMGARNGTSAVTMVQSGFTGILDVLDGRHNMFLALSTESQPEEMVADLGSRFYVAETAIKTFSVGYPIQSALDGLLTLRREHNLTADNVQHILFRLPTDGANIVNNSAMADVNLQHLVSLALIRGTVTFIDSHDQSLMEDPEILDVRSRVELIADDSLVVPEAPRSAYVEITRNDGSKVDLFTPYAPGTKERPLDTAGVSAKVRDLMIPVLGVQKTEALIARVNNLEDLDDIRQLRPLWTV
jgi:2-methylcitrate dehydratase PrpD